MEQDQHLLPSPSSLLKETFNHYSANTKSIGLIMLLPAIFIAVSYFYSIFDFVSSVIVLFAYPALAVLLLAPEKSETKSTIGYYKKGLSYVLPYILVSALIFLVTFGGLVLFIVPGLIFSVLLYFSIYGLVIEEKRGFAALITSYHYVKGRWLAVAGRLFSLALALIFISLVIGFAIELIVPGSSPKETISGAQEISSLSAILTGLFSYFVITPLTIIFGGLLYKELQKSPVHVMSLEEEKKVKRNLLILITIGVLAIIIFVVFFFTVFFGFFEAIKSGSLSGFN